MSALSAPFFHDERAAYTKLESILWPQGPVCPKCGGMDRITEVRGKTARIGLKRCGHCKRQFRVTVGTVFESGHVPLNLWLQCAHLLCSSKKGISSHQIHRILGVTYKTAWFMSHRLREAMREGKFPTALGGQNDDYLEKQFERAVRRVQGDEVEPDRFFKGIAIETLDGVIKELDARGTLVRGKLILTAGGKEIDCVFSSSDLPLLRESFDRRARVEAIAHYDGESLLPVRLDVKRLALVGGKDLVRWKGALKRGRDSGGLDLNDTASANAAGHMKRLSAQSKRFIKAAREHGASEDERIFDENLSRIAKAPAPLLGHWSDCALYRAPAYEPGPCDCSSLDLTKDGGHISVASPVSGTGRKRSWHGL